MDEQMLQQYIAMLLGSSQSSDGIGQQKSVANYQQDQLDLLGDPMLAALAGGGAFDQSLYQDQGTGKFDTYTIPSDPLAPYRNLSPDSLEGKVALAISEGFSPEEVASQFKAAGENDASTLDRVRKLGTDLFVSSSEYQSQLSSIPGFGQGEDGSWQYQGDGQIVGNEVRVPQTGRSAAAAQFDKAGLPTPDQQYGAQDFGFDPARQQAADAGLQALQQMQSEVSGQFKDLDRAKATDAGLASQGDQMLALLSGGGGSPDRPEFFQQMSGKPAANTADRLAELSGTAAWKPFGDMTPEMRRSLTDAVGRRNNGTLGAAARDQYDKRRREVGGMKHDFDNAMRQETYDKAYAERKAMNAAKAGRTPLSDTMMQRIAMLKMMGG